MPTYLPIYDVPEKPLDDAGLYAFLRVDEALSKLEERARLSPLRASWAQRLLFRNACAAMHTQNCLVHLEDLVLLDGHAFSGGMYPDLSCGLSILKLWQRGLQEDPLMLLRAPMPGEMPRLLSCEVTGDPLGTRMYLHRSNKAHGARLCWRPLCCVPGPRRATCFFPSIRANGCCARAGSPMTAMRNASRHFLIAPQPPSNTQAASSTVWKAPRSGWA